MSKSMKNLTVDTVLQIGSTTRQFTAAAILQLRDQGTYKGFSGRGEMVLDVTRSPEGIAFSVGGAPAERLPWVNGLTFRRKDVLLTFRRSANSGPAMDLRFDTGGDHFILKRQ